VFIMKWVEMSVGVLYIILLKNKLRFLIPSSCDGSFVAVVML